MSRRLYWSVRVASVLASAEHAALKLYLLGMSGYRSGGGRS